MAERRRFSTTPSQQPRRFSTTPLAPAPQKIAILAYGSLIDDRGQEIDAVLAERTPNIQTPFPVEYARSSRKRGGGPTLIPMPPDSGFSPVNAVLLVLRSGTSEPEATNMLYRREIDRVGSNLRYHPDPTNPNQVYVERLVNAFGCDVVLYTRIAQNIQPLTPTVLADLAVESARGDAGATEEDGISYLRRMIALGIATKLTPDYVKAIQERTKTLDAQSAWQAIRNGQA